MKHSPLAEIAHVISGFAFKSEWFGSGLDKIIRIGDLQNGIIDNENVLMVDAKKYNVSSNFKIEKNDILMALSGATTGKIAVAKEKDVGSYINQRVAIIRGKTIENASYVRHIFNGEILKRLLVNADGAAQANLSPKDLANLQIPIPALAEQQRIAALLDTADLIFKQRESAIAKLDQLAQSVYLNELRACDSSIFQLAEVADMYQPKTISANELIENGQYVVYGANGVIGRYDKFNHADSEVLVTCRGATCGTVNWSQPYAWITGNAMVIKPLNNIVTKDFLHYYFKFAADFSTVITGAAQPQITRQTLSRLTIVIPKLENQNKITNALREIYKKHDLMNLSKNKLQELIHSLQHQLFAVN